MTEVLLNPITETDGSDALADLLADGARIGLAPVTRQFLLFAFVCERAAQVQLPLREDLRRLSAASELLLPCPDELLNLVALPQPWNMDRLCRLLDACCHPSGHALTRTLSGKLVTLEGGDGSGKTTQTRELAAALRTRGLDVVTTRAIGGAPGGAEVLRAFILHPGYRWSGVAEVLLTIAVYREALAKVIVPALERGQWVVCDRLLDTMLAYFRNDALGLTLPIHERLFDILIADIAPGLRPDLTFLLDISWDEAIARREIRGDTRLDRNEDKGEAFHRNVLDTYRDLAQSCPRIVVVNAELSPAEVTAALEDLLDQHIARPESTVDA